MSAVAKDYAFVVKKKKDAKAFPVTSKERIEKAKANVAKHLVKK
jgi:hypothetical protein